MTIRTELCFFFFFSGWKKTRTRRRKIYLNARCLRPAVTVILHRVYIFTFVLNFSQSIFFYRIHTVFILSHVPRLSDVVFSPFFPCMFACRPKFARPLSTHLFLDDSSLPARRSLSAGGPRRRVCKRRVRRHLSD